MAQVLFVMRSKSGVGSLPHESAVQKRMAVPHCAQHTVDEAAMMPPPSDHMLNVLLMDKAEAVPVKKEITVQGIVEKSQTWGATHVKWPTAGLQVNITAALAVANGWTERVSNNTQPMR